jgi:chemotaxis regulatin CheY-phosphate phosphatase CheZ
VDSNQNHLQPGTMLTSMLKRVDTAVYNVAKNYQPGIANLGLKEGGVDYAMDDNNSKLVSADMKKKVDAAKADHAQIAAQTRRMAAAVVADPVKAVASGAVLNFVSDVEAATARIDAHLTDIMLAQDFHDLTGQVVARVVTLASELEDSLVHLLVQAAPPEQVQKLEQHLQGPVVSTEGRADVVTNQGEVDDLLASLGF